MIQGCTTWCFLLLCVHTVLCDVYFPGPYAPSNSFTFNGNAQFDLPNLLTIIPGIGASAGTAYYTTKQLITNGFTADFTYLISDFSPSGPADGITFTIQSNSLNAIGPGGGLLAYNFANCFTVEIDGYINPEYSDPSANHMSVHSALLGATNGPEETVYQVNAMIYSPPLFNLFVDGRPTRVVITYFNSLFKVDVYEDGVNPTNYFTSTLNLASYLNMPDGKAWVGFTAGSALVYSTNQITNFNFYEYNVDILRTLTLNFDPNSQLGVPNIFQIQLKDLDDNFVLTSGSNKNAFVSLLSTCNPSSLLDNMDGTYSITIIPNIFPCIVSVKINGIDIPNSPFILVLSTTLSASPTPSPTATPTRSPSPTPSASPSRSLSPSRTASPSTTSSKTSSRSASMSKTISLSPSITASNTPSRSLSKSSSISRSRSPSPSLSPSLSPSPSSSSSRSPSRSPVSPSPSSSLSPSASLSSSNSGSVSASISISSSASLSPSSSKSTSLSKSLSKSPSASVSLSKSPSPSRSASRSPSSSVSFSRSTTPSLSPSRSVSPSPSSSRSSSASPSPSRSASASPSPSTSSSASISISPTSSPSPSSSKSLSPSRSISLSPSPSLSLSSSTSNSPTPSTSVSMSPTRSESRSSSLSPSPSPSPSPSRPISNSPSPSHSASPSPSSSKSFSTSRSPSPSRSLSRSASPSFSLSISSTPSPSMPFSITPTRTSSVSPSLSRSASRTRSPSRSLSASSSESRTSSPSSSLSSSLSLSNSNSASPSPSPSASASLVVESPSSSSSFIQNNGNIQEPVPLDLISSSRTPSSSLLAIFPLQSSSAAETTIPVSENVDIPVRPNANPIFIDLNAPSSSQNQNSAQKEVIHLAIPDTGESISVSIAPPSGSSSGLLISVLPPPASSATSVLSITLLSSGAEISEFQEPVEICFSVSGEIKRKKNDACLSFQTDSGDWKCQDACLTENSSGFLCGETDHFTNFAILLGGFSGEEDCNGDFSQQVIAWLSLAFIIVAILFVMIAVALYEHKVRRDLKARSKLFRKARAITANHAVVS